MTGIPAPSRLVGLAAAIATTSCMALPVTQPAASPAPRVVTVGLPTAPPASLATASLTGLVLAPPNVISNNGGSIISDHAGGVISNNGGSLALLALPAEVPVAGIDVELLDATQAPLLDPFGNRLTARTDASGRYRFDNASLPVTHLLARASLPGDKGRLVAIVDPGSGVRTADLDLVSSLVTSYILDAYVEPQDQQEDVLARLTPAVEAATLQKAKAALAQADIALPDALTPDLLDATVEALRGKDPAFDQQMTTVEHLLVVIGSSSAAIKDGPALTAQLVRPWGLALGPDGALYIADNTLVRKLSPDGQLSTVAGGGPLGYADGPAGSARFYNAQALLLTANGTLYVADTSNQRLRTISPAGVVDTFAGTASRTFTEGPRAGASFLDPAGLAQDAAGNLYVADSYNHRIRKITPAGVVSTLAGSGVLGETDGVGSAASFTFPFGLVCDPQGILYVSDRRGGKVRKILPDGTVSTLAGGSRPGFANDTGATARFNGPSALSLEANGNLLVADTVNHCIRRITPAGVVTTVAGTRQPGYQDGPALTAAFNAPWGVQALPDGRIFVADSGNFRIRQIAVDGTVTTIAGNGKGQLADESGTNALFSLPSDVVADGHGAFFVADTGNNAIRKLLPGGNVVTVAGNGQVGAADGPGAEATFYQPSSLALDAAGTLYIADAVNGRVRKLTPDGLVTTLALHAAAGLTPPTLHSPHGIAVDDSGTLYISDTSNQRICKLTQDGTLSLLAGSGKIGLLDGLGAAASFSIPIGLLVDAAHNVYVADSYNNALRKITPDGAVTTLAGNGTSGNADGVGTAATLSSPHDVIFGPGGDLYVLDSHNHAIRRVAANGTVTTQVIDGLSEPGGFAWDGAASFYIADTRNHLIKQVPVTP